tara:strand:- start:218 stop:424 length:207 start_codon:yes stop_codon:yes gene_type:complete
MENKEWGVLKESLYQDFKKRLMKELSIEKNEWIERQQFGKLVFGMGLVNKTSFSFALQNEIPLEKAKR